MGAEKVLVPLHGTVVPTSYQATHGSWEGNSSPRTRLEWIPEGTKPMKLSFGRGTGYAGSLKAEDSRQVND